jgi:hypothetical protein
MDQVKDLKIDGQSLKVKAAPQIFLSKTAAGWREGKPKGLRKSHALQGPIDDAFLEPFLLVRPTGTPWNQAAHDQSLKMLARFDRVYARYYRAHPRIKDDKDITAADFANYHVALFGDPGSNRWIAKVQSKLPIKWTKAEIGVGTQTFPAATNIPALIYPNLLNPKRYVVINSGLTIDEREYHGDYSMPKLGDLAVLKVGSDTPDIAFATLFDEFWRLPQ